jgi:hypothetical protein
LHFHVLVLQLVAFLSICYDDTWFHGVTWRFVAFLGLAWPCMAFFGLAWRFVAFLVIIYSYLKKQQVPKMFFIIFATYLPLLSKNVRNFGVQIR